MRVIHIPYSFFPEPVGGAEVYVASLANEQISAGLQVTIAAPGKGRHDYLYDGIPVRQFPVRQEVNDLRELYGEGDELAAAEFARIMDEEKPDLVHLHGFTRALSLRLVHAAKARQVPVVFTYHTPTV